MKILAIECSATPCSAAVIENGKILASDFVNVGLTHSQILMPMAEKVVKEANLSFSDIEGFAVSAGPGSFTGIRIGISAAKGLAAARKLPCVPVSTLGAMAELFRGQAAYICAVMDARSNQFYNALFEVDGDKVTRLCDDRALLGDELKSQLETFSLKDKPVIVCGDGADLFLKYTQDLKNVICAPEHLKFQSAVGVAMCGEKALLEGNGISPEELLPVYLRLPQAERELKSKQQKETETKK